MFAVQPSINTEIAAAFRRAMRQHWGLFLAEGLVLLLLGLAAMALPAFAGIALTVILGYIFALAGIVGLISTFTARQAPGFGWSLLSALAALLAGGLLLWNPLQGLVTLTIVLTAFFIADGILMIILAISHRRQLSGKWEWILINGLIDLLLAFIVLSGFPGTVAWVLGLLVGIDMLFGGVSLVALALAARNQANL
ncbi:MAG TPA: DUF308 domain-containing protein [Acidocella sp.]|nr:MAG: hypothetical protein B7Z77_06230 [Acidocella sp. 20-58-15]HQT38741.1 DUF308 domain-containing protein [Acidocella sp.]